MTEEQLEQTPLEPVADILQTEEDLIEERQRIMAAAPWNAVRISKGQANWMMILQALAFLAISIVLTHRPFYQISLINETLVVLLPGLLFVWVTRRSFKKVYRFRPLSAKMVGTIIGMSIGIYPLTVLINALVMMLLNQFMELTQPVIQTGGTLGGYLLSIIVVCLVPSICEEMMFRGIIFHAYEEDGRRYAIWMGAFLFAIFHFSIQNFIGPFLLGVYFGYLVYGTGSIYAAMIAHFVHNLISNTLTFIMELSHVLEIDTDTLPSVEMIAGKDLMIGFMVISIFVLIGLIVFIKLSRTLIVLVKRRDKEYRGLVSEEAKVQQNQEFLSPKDGNLFEQVPIWLMILTFMIVNIVNILM